MCPTPSTHRSIRKTQPERADVRNEEKEEEKSGLHMANVRRFFSYFFFLLFGVAGTHIHSRLSLLLARPIHPFIHEHTLVHLLFIPLRKSLRCVCVAPFRTHITERWVRIVIEACSPLNTFHLHRHTHPCTVHIRLFILYLPVAHSKCVHSHTHV